MEQLLLVAVLLFAGLFLGAYNEMRHYKSIKEREAKELKRPTIASKRLPDDMVVKSAAIATGSAVISIDYFKRFTSILKSIVGGELKSYSSLIDRARREAILRMKESQPKADLFVNVRLETSTISSGSDRISSIEVLAYSTAIVVEQPV